MAAYAALVSLTNIMEQIQNHMRLSASVDKNQIDSLVKVVDLLQAFLENCGREAAAQVLESQIASAAYAAEDVIENHIVDQINYSESIISLLDLRNVIEEMESVHKEAMKAQEEMGDKKKSLPTYPTPAASSRPPRKMNTMVGFDDELLRLMDMLAGGGQSNRQIVLIHGMGGIGKTTLTRNAYENLLIKEHFDTRSWATISQAYSVKRILFDLLSIQKEEEYNEKETEETKLGEKLYKTLFGRRYLVILDDMWSVEAWDRIRTFVPDNNNGSRVVITTRQSQMSSHLGCFSLSMRFLDEDQSWKLFCENVFAQEGCPPKFQKIGKEIAKSCKGLPLSISVIGGYLRKSSRTIENWENIAKDINSILSSGEDEQCSNILSLSYDYLPVHLKPCFLYMGIFQEDTDIRVSRLIKLWVADGFLKPNKSQSMEMVAQGYLQDLIDRNLIMLAPKHDFWLRKIKRCTIHDLVRDLCLKAAKKENFLHVMKAVDLPGGIDSEHRRIVIHQTIGKEAYDRHGGKLAIPLVRSLICKRDHLPSKFKLLRVLHMEHNYDDSAEAIFDHVNVRYLAYEILANDISNLPRSIFRGWNLQTLIVGVYYVVDAPIEIWEMRQLRHIHFFKISLPIPPQGGDQGVGLPNLQTLKKVVNFTMSEEVRRRILNIKKLHLIVDNIEFRNRINFGHLDELESLKIEFYEVPSWNSTDPWLKLYKWPTSLKELTLYNGNLHWDDLTTMGLLPLLEALKLDGFPSVSGAEWNPIDGEFRSLKSLWILGIRDLIHWNADSSHFPKLENLYLEGAIQLEEIPLDIGDIPTLELVKLSNCSVSSAISAMKIVEEQEGCGNEDLKVDVEFFDEKKLEMFMEKVAQESFTTSNDNLSVTLNWVIQPLPFRRSHPVSS